MRFPDPVEAPLVAVEAAAAPVALVASLLMVVLGGLVATAVRIGLTGVGTGGTVVGVATGLVAVLTLLVLLAAAGAAVEGYRRRFAETGGGSNLLIGLFVPAILVVAALAYAASRGHGLASPPLGILAVAGLGAHAVAFRAIAMYSMPDARRRQGSAVAGVAALPAALGLAAWLTEGSLDGPAAVAGEHLVAGLDAAGVPRWGIAVVLVPLAVSIGYAVYRTRTAPAGSSSPAQTSLPRSPTLPQPSRVPDASLRGTASHVRDRIAAAVPGLGGAGRANSSGGASGGGASRPPVSASSSRRRSGSGSGGSSGGGSGSTGGSSSGGSSGRSSGGSGDSSAGAADGGGTDRGAGGSSSGGSSSDRDRSSRGVRKIGGSSAGSGTGGSAADGGASTGSSGAGGSSSGAGGGSADEESSGSDTRIFTGDFGSYGDDTVDVCPACEETIPSDGVYRFCPFCGEEL